MSASPELPPLLLRDFHSPCFCHPQAIGLGSDFDYGYGLPDNHADAKPGLGTGIVNALAGQLAATVDVTDNNPGTKVTVACAPAQVAEPLSRAV